MTAKKSSQISYTPGSSSRLGVFMEQDGITFSAAVPEGERAELILYQKGTEDILARIPFPDQPRMGRVRSVKVSGVKPDKLEYNFKIGTEITQDPFARIVTGRRVFGDLTDRGEHQVRCGFLNRRFDWGGVEQSQIPYEDAVMYQLHVRGFTRQKNSGVRHKGTFLGLQEKIPYLKALGITSVVLMPAYEFDEVMREKTIEHGGGNSWQRKNEEDFQVKPSVNTAEGAETNAGVGTDVKTETKAAPDGTGKNSININVSRNSDIRVCPVNKKLNYWGYGSGFYYAPKASYSYSDKPDLEFKAMVRALHENGMELIMQFSFPDPVDTDLVNDCLVWWMQEYHVDGFWLLTNQETACGAAKNPFLRSTKLITGYFPGQDPGSGEQNTRVRNLADCNDGFMIDCRKMLKGDENQLEAFVNRIRQDSGERAVINYMTNHDGFTLMDLVSYDKKHNEENGELGSDGSGCNFSWNCGVEGPTRKRSILGLRMRQMKNAFAILLLAQGTPMLMAGDEFGNSQQGNNNPYCHDSELTWVDWSRQKANQELTEFVKELLSFRKAHRILHMAGALTGTDLRSVGYPDFSCHSSRAWYGDFEYTNRHVGVMYCGQYAGEEGFIYVAYNFHWEPQKLALPYLPEGVNWQIVLDTRENAKKEIVVPGATSEQHQRSFEIPERCVQILLGK